MFESHLYCAFRPSAQNIILVEVLLNKSLTEKKPLRMMLFQDRNTHKSHLLGDLKILKYFDKTALESRIFINKSLKGYYHQPSTSGLNFHLNFLIMLQDG